MKLSLLVVTAAFAFTATPAAAQFAIEVRGGAAVGNHVPAAAGLEAIPGPSYAVQAEYQGWPIASIYASVSRSSFGCEEGFCTDNTATVTTMGYGAGVRIHSARLPWVRAGAILYDASVDAENGSKAVNAAPGYEMAAGFTIPLGPAVRILPGAFFRSQPGDERTTVIGAEIGLQVSFGR